jgi:hypothetical protein
MLREELLDIYFGEHIFNIGTGVGLVSLLNDPGNHEKFGRLRHIRFTDQVHVCNCGQTVTISLECSHLYQPHRPRRSLVTLDLQRLKGEPWFGIVVRMEQHSTAWIENCKTSFQRALQGRPETIRIDEEGRAVFPDLNELMGLWRRVVKELCAWREEEELWYRSQMDKSSP